MCLPHYDLGMMINHGYAGAPARIPKTLLQASTQVRLCFATATVVKKLQRSAELPAADRPVSFFSLVLAPVS